MSPLIYSQNNKNMDKGIQMLSLKDLVVFLLCKQYDSAVSMCSTMQVICDNAKGLHTWRLRVALTEPTRQ